MDSKMAEICKHRLQVKKSDAYKKNECTPLKKRTDLTNREPVIRYEKPGNGERGWTISMMRGS